MTQRALKPYRIICVAYAGFATLHDERSIEPNVTIIGKFLYRGGVIRCLGFLLGRRCAKIQRVCRSALCAECRAAVTAGGYAIRYQILLIELLNRRYQIRKLRHPSNFAMLNPFGKGPTGAQLKEGNLLHIHMEFGPALTSPGEIQQADRNHCECPRLGIALFAPGKPPPKPLEEDLNLDDVLRGLYKPTLLTDCCILFSSIPRMQPNAQERCSGIILAHLRDLQPILNISSIDATVNLGDVGTKHGGSNSILRKFMIAGRFGISFVGRKAPESARANKNEVS